MRNLKFLIILLFFSSCTYLFKDEYITKKEAYRINKKYIKEKYYKEIDEKDVGFVIHKGTYNFSTYTESEIYKVKIDFNGKVIE